MSRSKIIAEGSLTLKSVLSGLFPVLTVIAYSNFLSPITTLAWSSLIASIFFAIFLTFRKEWTKNIKNVRALKDIVLTILFIVIGFHLLFFLSLKFTSAQNVSLLSLLEVVFSFIIIGWISKKEPISKKHALGATLMLTSAAIILFGNINNFSIGDLLIIIATILAPIGNIFAKRALHQISLTYLLFLRSFVGAFIFFIASFIFEDFIPLDIIWQSMPYLLFSGIIYLGFMKIVTMFSFKKTSVTHTISFHSLKPVFTFIFAWLLLKEAPTNIQIIAVIPSLAGLYLLVKAKQKQTKYGFEKIR